MTVCIEMYLSANPHLCQLCGSRFTLMSVAILKFVANFDFVIVFGNPWKLSGAQDTLIVDFSGKMMLRGCKTWFYLSLMGN